MQTVPAVAAIEVLKEQDPARKDVIGVVLRKMAADKRFSLLAVKELARRKIFGALVEKLLLNNGSSGQADLFDAYGALIDAIVPSTLFEYRSQSEQNQNIDRALSVANPLLGQGASPSFSLPRSLGLSAEITQVPIAIIGYGASGILLAFALLRAGFNRLSVFEKSEQLGIWRQKNVYGLSRNNPLPITFFDRTLEKAPGGGAEVKNFLENLVIPGIVHRKTVKTVKPGRLRQRLNLTDGTEEDFPIVINAIGLGKPVPLSDPNRMTTTAQSARYCGSRWQQKLTAAEVRGKRFILIGLGNSTGEMLRQINRFMEQGVPVDYRIITHYPTEAVFNPTRYVYAEGRNYRVFRDLSLPNLVDWQGDLPEYRRDYFRALRAGKIIPGVKHWEVKQNWIGVYDEQRRLLEQVTYDHLFTLTGYKHQPTTLTELGIPVEPQIGCASYDYDGEFADPIKERSPERRLCGYFGFGAVLDAPYNPNAIVIPGMIFRLGDLLFGIAIRATEYVYGK